MVKVTSYYIIIVAPGYIKMLKSSGWSVNMFSMVIKKACHLINRDILHKVLSWWFYVRPQCARIIVMKTTKMCKRKYMNDYCPNRKRTSSSFIHKLPPWHMICIRRSHYHLSRSHHQYDDHAVKVRRLGRV